MTEKKEVPKQKMFYNKFTEKTLIKSIELNMPLLMIGDTGSGKTSFIRELARERGINLVRVNLTGQTGIDEVIGKWIVKGKEMVWINGPLIDAMQNGDFIVFDEINMALPEILSALHSLLDDDKKVELKEKENEIIYCHERFRFFATMNPPAEYAGTKELNKAFFSRFPLVLRVEYSSEEAKIISDRTGIDLDDASRLVLGANEVRRSKAKGQDVYYTCSTRDLIYTAELMTKGFDSAEAIHLSILNKIDDDSERETVKKLFELVTGEKILLNCGREGGLLEFKSLSEITEMVKKIKENETEIKNKLELATKDIRSIREEAGKRELELNDKLDIARIQYVKMDKELKSLYEAKKGMTNLMLKLKIPAKTINEVLGAGTVNEKKPTKLKKEDDKQ